MQGERAAAAGLWCDIESDAEPVEQRPRGGQGVRRQAGLDTARQGQHAARMGGARRYE